MVVCSYEDRRSDLVGLRLLVSSLGRHLPGVPVVVGCPEPGAELERWLRARPGVTLDKTRDARLGGWNVKAGLLARLLEAGHEEVLWIDSDVVVARDFRGLVTDATSLVATEEISRGGARESRARAEGWGLPVARELPALVNSAFLRVTRAHAPLVAAWIALLQSPAYEAAQALPFAARPKHMISDQDVLTALLCSRDFVHVDVKLLARGRDVIHDINGGYPATARIANLFRPMPPLVHAQGLKPWRFEDKPALLREPSRYYRFVQAECSPYRYVARQYDDGLGERPAFFEVRSLAARVVGLLMGGNPHLHGLPHAVIEGVRIRAELAAERAARAASLVTGRVRALARAASPATPTLRA
jgi:hypothetical protein